MATLNGVEFKIIEIEWSSYQNNVIQEVLGSDTVEVQNQGHGSDPVRIKGMVRNEQEMDNFQEEFYSNGVLTFIKDPNSGRQYSIYALGNVKRENISNTLLGTSIIFTCVVQLRYPYSESVDTITRSKSITTQNQEWSADDDGIDIKTDGNVDAVPDIQVIGETGGVYEEMPVNPLSEPGFETITDWVYSETDTYGTLTGAQDNVYEYAGTYCYRLELSGHIAPGDLAKILQDIDLAPVKKISFQLRWITSTASPQVRMKIYGGSQLLETYDNPGSSQDTGWVKKELVIDSNYDSLSFRLATTTAANSQNIKCLIDDIIIYTKTPTRGPEIYNTTDTSVKCILTDEILDGAIHRINPDGTGTIDFDEDFSDRTYAHTRYDMVGITYDDTYNKINIADDGYIYWKCNPGYPIAEVPSLTSQIDITSGIPTIQISDDASTWYDIDTSIIDDVDTTYLLKSDGNLSILGKSLFYFRYDCIKTSAATCSVKSFKLDVDIHTIYAKNPKITKGSSASTFRVDQASDSCMLCEIDLMFKHRWWI